MMNIQREPASPLSWHLSLRSVHGECEHTAWMDLSFSRSLSHTSRSALLNHRTHIVPNTQCPFFYTWVPKTQNGSFSALFRSTKAVTKPSISESISVVTSLFDLPTLHFLIQWKLFLASFILYTIQGWSLAPCSQKWPIYNRPLTFLIVNSYSKELQMFAFITFLHNV